MKKVKALVSLILSFVLIFSTVEMLKISAYTDGTKYSVKHLQNGNFEDNKDSYKFSSNYVQPVKTGVPYWDTTAYNTTGQNGKFEFFKSTSDHFNITKKYYPNNPEYLNVAEGEVAAELNADEESSIYQRINTVAGSTYTWGLYHRGRDTTDSMVLIIGPEQQVDPSKPSKKGQDQFVRITNWLKTQYGVSYPETGCSPKYTVYSRPFAANGNFEGNINDDDQNISMVATEDINQEWSVWVISSPYCNIADENTKNGWSAYGTNTSDDIEDIMKGASSKLNYDCTYTVPKGQTNTLFAFCSFSSGRESGPDATFGNLLDDINFDLYQPISSSVTEGGIGSVSSSDNITIDSDIISGDSLHTIVPDEEYCTVYTNNYNEGTLKNCKFVGAYVTINNDDGTSVTKFVTPYEGDISNLSDEKIEELSKTYFIPKTVTDSTSGKTWQYYFRVSVVSPVSIHLIYTKAPFVLYDSNGGKDYYFSPDNTVGGNLVGFADQFIKVFDKDDADGNPTYVDTSAYYSNYQTVTVETGDEAGQTKIIPGKYISHAALPNESWETNDDGTSSHMFCGWSVLDNDGKQVVIDGVHTIEYNPTEGTGGMVSISDSDGSVKNLLLDAEHGITLTALWKFVHRAQAQTYNIETESFEDSAVGGTVEETLISDDLRSTDVKEYTEFVNGEERVDCVDAAGEIGDKIMFKAIPDSANNYAFLGWYYREKQSDGTYEEVLRSTSTSIAVTIEEGKLNTYYAKFRLKTIPVVFNYTSTGSCENYDYYKKSPDNPHGEYFQNVIFRETAKKPTGDSVTVKTWYTSPTERGTEYIFDFENTPITEETNLYAGPSFTYNYFNYFKLKEPWYINTYGTLKFGGNYIDLKKDANVSDYNVYMLKGTLGENAPLPSEIINNSSTIKVGKSVNSDKLIFNTLTSTGQTFNRAGAVFDDFYLFNMKTPVWVVFDYTYKGITYTSTVKNRSLYNCIETYMNDNNKLYTNYPPKEQADLRTAQTDLLNSIKNMYDKVSVFEITQPSDYADASSVSGLTYDSSTYGTYTFESSTAIRNIEPWGLKYSFTVKDNTVTDNTETENTENTENSENTENTDTGNIVTTFSDYGAVVLTDKDGTLNADSLSIQDMLKNENSVMYSKSKGNVYSGENGAVEIYYVNNMRASDFDKKTYVVFFVKASDGKYYYSNIINNSYTSLASDDTSEYKDVSASIITYSEKLNNYCKLIEQLNKARQ